MQPLIWLVKFGSVFAAGDALNGRLPPSPRHPKGRNSYAHVAKCIKSHYGCSYKELDDSYYDDVMNYILD